MPNCLICKSHCHNQNISGNNYFHFECYNYLRKDHNLRSYEGIDDEINKKISNYYANHSFLKRIKHFLFRSVPKEIKSEITHFKALKQVLQTKKYYKAFRRRRLQTLYDYWSVYDFDNIGLPPDWPLRRTKRLKQDSYTCQDCDWIREENGTILHIHHITVRGDGEVYDHTQENLVTLCIDCHRERHGGVLPDDTATIGINGRRPFSITNKYKLIEEVIRANENRSTNEQICILVLYKNKLQDISYRAILPTEKTYEILLNGNSPYWYVKGYCYLQQERRTFRISRIKEIEEINQNEIPPEGGKFL
jgi:hypothetical protein